MHLASKKKDVELMQYEMTEQTSLLLRPLLTCPLPFSAV